MASLKEVKNRIASVNSTRKITSAMKMVSSSKLHKAQQAIESMRPYEERLNSIMHAYVKSIEEGASSPLLKQRKVRRVAIVILTSNSSLCGAFNNNVIKSFRRIEEQYHMRGAKVVRIYALGKKGYEAITNSFKGSITDGTSIIDNPSYASAASIATELLQSFIAEELDEVKLIYNHFHSNSKQILIEEQYLPVQLEREKDSSVSLDYILEPSGQELLETLLPKALCLKIYAAVLDSIACEHAARVIAMQTATDNADELLQELTLTYNKTRQQAITTELLDLVGGSIQ